MSYNPDTWTFSSNEALQISIADSNGSFAFKPLFTYPIFGDSEQIFGYKDLEIKLIFETQTFLPLLIVKYSEKLNDDVDDVEAKLLEFLPESTIVNDEPKWIAQFQKEQKQLKYDKYEVVDSYSSKTRGEIRDFEVVKTKFGDPFTTELNKRLQIFVLLFIEAGSYIDTSDDLWDLYLILGTKEKDIVGFATTYSYFKYNGFEEFDASTDYKKRNKISQFVVLPPYQNSTHGSQLYNAIVEHWTKDPLIEEITIEDPNEKFDDLRYRNDFKRLFEVGFLSNLPKDFSQLTNQWFKDNAKLYKIELQQFKKLVEIGYLYNNQNLKLARLLIKRRLYEKNKDGLLELDVPVRNDKLQTAYESIKADYQRLLESVRLRDNFDDRVIKKQKI